MSTLRLGIPKGSLEEATIELFRKSGWRISVGSRSYFPSVDDPTLRCNLIRAQEMARYVEAGTLDAGITGHDWILENDSKVEVIRDLVYSKATIRPTRWVLVVPNASPVQKPEDLRGKKIATELVNYTRRFFAERHIDVTVEFNGQQIYAASAKHGFGTVLASLVAYAKAQRPEYPLKAGTIITTGSVCGLVPISGTGHAVAVLGNHRVEFDIV